MSDMDLRRGTVVESLHHGRGVVEGIIQGKYKILFNPKRKGKKHLSGGGVFHYSPDGRYFTEGEFADEKSVLKIIKQPEEEK